jgi:hypothetical protein
MLAIVAKRGLNFCKMVVVVAFEAAAGDALLRAPAASGSEHSLCAAREGAVRRAQRTQRVVKSIAIVFIQF